MKNMRKSAGDLLYNQTSSRSGEYLAKLTKMETRMLKESKPSRLEALTPHQRQLARSFELQEPREKLRRVFLGLDGRV